MINMVDSDGSAECFEFASWLEYTGNYDSISRITVGLGLQRDDK